MAAILGMCARWLAAAPLLGAALLCAQSAPSGTVNGGVAGRLTDLHSKPLSGITIILRNTLTGTETRATTTNNGAWRFAALAPGEYTLEAQSPQLGQGHVQGIEVSAGYEAHVQAAVQLEPVSVSPPEVATATHEIPTASTVPVTITLAAQPVEAFHPQPHALAQIQPAQATQPPALMAKAVPQPFPSTPPAISAPAKPEPKLEPLFVAHLEPTNAESAPEMASADQRSRATFANLASSLAALRNSSQAAVPILDTPQLSASSTTLTGQEICALPVAGRDWQQFTLDAPPAGNQTSGTEGSKFGEQVRGASTVLVDGANTRLAFDTKASGRSSQSLLGPAANESTIHSVETMDQSAAGNGRTLVETRSGGPDIHAEASLFTRQNLWDAQNPFSQWLQQTLPATATTVPVFTAFPYTPSNHEAIWSANLSGPLRRYQMRWFAAVQGSERSDPGVATVKHPTDFFAQPTNDEMQVLSARLGLPSANPVIAGLAAYSSMLNSLTGLLGPAPRSTSGWSGFGRVDWNAAERHRFMLEGSGMLQNSPGGGLHSATESYGNHSFGARRVSSQWLLGRWEAFLTSNLLSVTQASIGREILSQPADTPSAFEQAFNINAWRQLPQIIVDSRYGFTIGNPSRFGAGSYPDEHIYEFQQGLDWVHDKLLVKAGFDLRHNADATSMIRNHTGTYHYSRLENFASDALVFAQYGIAGELNPNDQHNCDQRGKAWRDSSGQLHGLGYLPCYSWYSQTLGPTEWQVSTNDWAGFATAQWQPAKTLVLTASARWELEQIPPPIALVNNPDLPLTQKLPALGSEFAPRVGLAWGTRESRWPVLQLGYGMYYGRTANSVIEAALTQTGSPNGDLNFFMRPTDNLPGGAGGAPPFPYVLAGQPSTFVKPGAVEFAPQFRNPEIHQAVAGLEESLPGHLRVSVTAQVSLARRLPITVDQNFDPAVNPGAITYSVVDPIGAGPIKTTQITVPFYASWPAQPQPTQSVSNGRLNPNYQQIVQLMSRANSTYEAGTVRLSRMAMKGLSLHLLYTYAHAMDWNPNETAQVSGASVLDPDDFQEEYGTSSLDMRHSASGIVLWEAPWKLTRTSGRLANGWTLAATGHYHSGLPYTMRVGGAIPEEFLTSGAAIVGLGPGINGYGGDNRVYGVGRNTYRYPATWKADIRLGRRFLLPHSRELELMAESFNLFNHQNVTEIETMGYYIEPASTPGLLPTLNFMTGLKTGETEFGQPVNVNATDFYRPRQIDFGLRFRFKNEPEIEP
jgi:Carboxypeptidase regulatory-like domain